jgi:hypothetical protein
MRITRFVLYSALILATQVGHLAGQAEQSSDYLTLDGSTLTVGAVGANKTLTLTVKELKLINGGKIVTNGNVLHIEAVRIISEGGQIISFLPNNRRPPDSPEAGKAGAHGGEVQISAQTLSGKLEIDLSGQNGGLGGRGANGTPGTNGARGNNGVDGLLQCLHPGTDGGPGGNGTPGSLGFPGGAAGNGGNLILIGKAARALSSNIFFSAKPGDPGPGGSGGLGGAAGQGGEGGSGSVHCGGGHGGPSGQPGPSGAPGPSGSMGQSGSIKL